MSSHYGGFCSLMTRPSSSRIEKSKIKLKMMHRANVSHLAEAYPGFRSIKRLYLSGHRNILTPCM